MKLKQMLVYSVFLVPVTEKGNWQELKYSKINSHKIEFSKKGMKVKVEASAMPLIYPLPKVHKIKKIVLAGKMNGKLNLKKNIKQGKEGNDDFAIRLGLVIPGEKTLPFYKRAFAPAWIKKLFDLVPKGSGVDHIAFYNAVNNAKTNGESRVHPLGKGLMKEKNIWVLNKTGKFNLEYEFKEPVTSAALWLSMDGDDTGSKFDILFTKMEITE